MHFNGVNYIKRERDGEEAGTRPRESKDEVEGSEIRVSWGYVDDDDDDGDDNAYSIILS